MYGLVLWDGRISCGGAIVEIRFDKSWFCDTKDKELEVWSKLSPLSWGLLMLCSKIRIFGFQSRGLRCEYSRHSRLNRELAPSIVHLNQSTKLISMGLQEDYLLGPVSG